MASRRRRTLRLPKAFGLWFGNACHEAATKIETGFGKTDITSRKAESYGPDSAGEMRAYDFLAEPLDGGAFGYALTIQLSWPREAIAHGEDGVGQRVIRAVRLFFESRYVLDQSKSKRVGLEVISYWRAASNRQQLPIYDSVDWREDLCAGQKLIVPEIYHPLDILNQCYHDYHMQAVTEALMALSSVQAEQQLPYDPTI